MAKDISRRLFALGFLTLFLELALIRYLAGNIWNLGYFPNLVLIAVFIGMGAGFTLHREVDERVSARLFLAAPALLLFLAVVVLVFHPSVPGFERGQGDLGGDLYFTSYRVSAVSSNFLLFGVWLLLVAGIFALLAQRTAKYFRTLPPLKAYSLDIAGSCAGIVLFMALSRLRAPAALWFLVMAPVFAFAAGADSRRVRSAHALLLALCSVVAWRNDRRLLIRPESADAPEVLWSPYQKIEFSATEHMAPSIWVNGIFHQQMVFADGLRGERGSLAYLLPYADRRARAALPPYRSVLILGAGSGNDVAAALQGGAERVDAVEIDPVIASLGRTYHPLRPYDDPRVELSVADGRAFMTRTRRTYDLIVFALTDSVVKVSPMSQLRLENYLFTEESVRRAYALLNDHGDLLFYNAYRQPWVYEKIAAMLTRATGAPPRVLFQNGTVLMLSAEKDAARLHPDLAPPPPDLPTDDWPFLYLLRRGIPGVYLRAMALVAACALGLLAFMRKRAARIPELARLPASVPLAFLFMGTAFSLLETKSVIQFSLLFGTTWVNNSLVFLTVLLLVLAANWTAAVLKRKPLWAVYGLLCASCLATLVYPLGRLLEIESTAARLLLASLMTFLPIYFANVLFSASFQNQAAAEYVFGWNLIGAMLGAVIEYASLALGYNALSAIVILCYTATFFLLRGQSIGSSALSDSRRR